MKKSASPPSAAGAIASPKIELCHRYASDHHGPPAAAVGIARFGLGAKECIGAPGVSGA